MLARKENFMKRFKVKLHGKNFFLNLDGEPRKLGFYATRFVKAENPEEAEKIAVILTHQNPNLRKTLLNEKDDRPKINLEGIKEINFLKDFRNNQSKDNFLLEEV